MDNKTTTMESIDNFYGYFNLVLGITMTLIGFKVYKPFKKDNEEQTYRKFGNLFKYGGIAMTIWGLLRVFQFL